MNYKASSTPTPSGTGGGQGGGGQSPIYRMPKDPTPPPGSPILTPARPTPAAPTPTPAAPINTPARPTPGAPTPTPAAPGGGQGGGGQSPIEDIESKAKNAAADTRWFNGSSESILARLDRLQDILDTTRTAASQPNVNTTDLERYANIITELGAEKETLEKIASEYVDFDTEQYLNNLPGGTIAKEYRLSSAGTFDIGEDDGSLLYRTAASLNSEYEYADWINFVTAGAEVWVEDQSHHLLDSHLNTREAAVYYVERKTLPILDVEKRAAIIDNFVDNVEICRRAKKEGSAFHAIKSARINKVASSLKEQNIDQSFGDNLNWL